MVFLLQVLRFYAVMDDAWKLSMTARPGTASRPAVFVGYDEGRHVACFFVDTLGPWAGAGGKGVENGECSR